MTRTKTRPRLAVVTMVAALAGGVGVPLAATASAAAVPAHPCGLRWTAPVVKSYSLFAPNHKSVTVYASPNVKALKPIKSIKDPMPDGTRGVMLGYDNTVVKGMPNGWLKVLFGTPTNRSNSGYVRVKDVVGALNTYGIQINRASHTLVVTKGGSCYGKYQVAVGAPSTPTPSGTFFVNDRIKAPNAAYGHWLLGTDAASPAFKKFDGLDAAIGIHGTNEDSSVGRSVSHGCVRMHIRDSDRIYPLIQSGTPIIIT